MLQNYYNSAKSPNFILLFLNKHRGVTLFCVISQKLMEWMLVIPFFLYSCGGK